MQVKLNPGSAGGRTVTVDGIQWGCIIKESRGNRGATYCWQQSGSGRYIKTAGQNGRGPEATAVVRLLNVKRPGAERPYPDRKSLDAALLAQTLALIKDGLLRNRDVVAAEIYAEQQVREKASQKAKDAKRAAWKAKARTILPKDSGDYLVDRVIELMEWAQTQ